MNSAATFLLLLTAAVFAVWGLVELVQVLRRWIPRRWRRMLDTLCRWTGRAGAQGWWICREMHWRMHRALLRSFARRGIIR